MDGMEEQERTRVTSAPFSLRTGKSKGKAGSCGSCLNLAVLAEGFPDSLGKSLQLLGIKAAELSCLGSQMPVADKLAECNLFCLGSSLIIKGCFFCIFFPERARQYHEADTDGGQQQPGKGTDIDNVFTTCKAEK